MMNRNTEPERAEQFVPEHLSGTTGTTGIRPFGSMLDGWRHGAEQAEQGVPPTGGHPRCSVVPVPPAADELQSAVCVLLDRRRMRESSSFATGYNTALDDLRSELRELFAEREA